MKTLLTLIFILSSTLSHSAGTDSGGNSSSGGNNSSSNDPKGPYSNNNVDVNIEYHRAKKLIYKKKYSKGLKILENIEDEKPFGYKKADLYNYMGFASRKQKNPNYENAENYYLKALSLDGDHIGALEYLGELYFETNREDMARALLDRLSIVAGESSNEYKKLSNLLN